LEEQLTVFGTGVQLKLNPNAVYEWSVQTMCDRLIPRGSTVVIGAPFTTGQQTALCSKIDVSGALVINSAKTTRVQWTPSPGINQYEFTYQPVDSSMIMTTVLRADTNFIYLYTLNPDTKYRWKVRPVCEGAVFSDWAYMTTGSGSACEPVQLKAEVAITSAIVYWSSNEAAISYKIYINGTLYSAAHPINIFTLYNLTPGTVYNLIVIPNCPDGPGDMAAMNFETMDYAVANPTQLQAAQDASNDLVITWIPTPDIDSQELLINGSRISLPPTQAAYLLTNPSPASKYNILLRSVTGTDKSTGAFTQVEIKGYCQAISSVSTIAKDHQSIKLAWPDVPGASHYSFRYKSEDDLGFSAPVVLTTSTYRLIGAAPNKQYSFEINAVCGGESSNVIEYTDTTLVLPQCPVAYDLQVSELAPTSFKVNFKISHGADEGVFTVAIQNGANPPIFFPATTSPVLISGLTPNLPYDITITNDCSANPSVSQSAAVTTPKACTSPANLIATLTTENTVLTSVWDAVSGVTGYGIRYRKLHATDWQTLPDQPGVAFSVAAESSLYEVEVTSIYADGRRCATVVVTQVPKVLDVAANSLNPDGAIIWSPIQGVDYYKVLIDSLDDDKELLPVNAAIKPYFKPLTTYSTTVQAIYNGAAGPVSDPLVHTTNNVPIDETEPCVPAEFTASLQDSHLNDPTIVVSTKVDIIVRITDYNPERRYKVEILNLGAVVPVATESIAIAEEGADGDITFMQLPAPALNYIVRVTWFDETGTACSADSNVNLSTFEISNSSLGATVTAMTGVDYQATEGSPDTSLPLGPGHMFRALHGPITELGITVTGAPAELVIYRGATSMAPVAVSQPLPVGLTTVPFIAATGERLLIIIQEPAL
jgi:hypothetical protein